MPRPTRPASIFALCLLPFALGLALPASHQVKRKAESPAYESDVYPALSKYCISCHQGDHAPDGVRFGEFASEKKALAAGELWKRVRDNLASKAMPPSGSAAPSPAQTKAIITWIDAKFPPGKDCDVKVPGRVTLRRLNRAEYNNSVRDLLGINFKPADDFPSDDVGYGFDNIGDVLSISPLLMEKYLSAAEQIVGKAIRVPDTAHVVFDVDHLQPKGGATVVDDDWEMYTEAEVSAEHEFKRGGQYKLRVRAWAQQSGEGLAKMAVAIDHRIIQTFDVGATKDKPLLYEVPVTAQAGKHLLTAAFTNDHYEPSDPDPNHRDRNLFVQSIELVGPFGGMATLPDSHLALLPSSLDLSDKDAAARQVLGRFAKRAFRRPVLPAELDKIISCYRLAQREGEPFERGIQLGLEAILVSPNFIFRAEVDPAGISARNLNGYEVATRLSYFLWSSTPDDELLSLADQGTLTQPATLKAQIDRMITSPKALALTENFAGQWLQLRKLATFAPDQSQFPQFGDQLREDMIAESTIFFSNLLRQNGSVLDFIDCDYAYVNDRLAALYGISNVSGSQFQKVKLQDRNRGGLLAQASILAVTSNPTRTSPVKRGKWILENLLGTPPPPPPPGVGNLSEDKKFVEGLSLRQRMEEHRKNPACATCHARMDALGFGLENFNAIGAWRTKDGKFEVDPKGSLPDGRSFSTPAELKKILMASKNDFVKCLASKLLTYATGRGMESGDKCAIDAVAKQVAKQNYGFRSLIAAVVFSDPFLKKGASTK